MKTYQVDQIRNIALLGHGGSGKTTLVESIAFSLGLTKRMGKVDDGNTISDFDKEEIARKFSIGTSVMPVEANNDKINFLDTPGYFDFAGDVFCALRVAGAAVILMDASAGIEVGTEKSWDYCEERNLPRLIFLNKMDKDNVDFGRLIGQLQDKFGKKIAPFAIPIMKDEHFAGFINVVDLKGRCFDDKGISDCEIPKGYEDEIAMYRSMLIEAVAESDETLLEKFFDGVEFTEKEFHDGLRKGVVLGNIIPVIFGSAEKSVGVQTLIDVVTEYMPTPKDMHNGESIGIHPTTEAQEVRQMDEKEPFSALVFKTVVDPFVGKISLFKVYSGSISKDTEVLNANKDEIEKLGALFVLRGKQQVEATKISAGDIGATAKLQYTETGHTLCDKNKPIRYESIDFPVPCLFLAVEPKAKGDEDKIGSSLQRLKDEDPSFSVFRNAETRQLLIGGQGTMQLAVITHKLKNIFGVDVALADQKIPYRETIKGRSEVQGKHKKQSGGAGQYGDVHIRFEHCDTEFEFVEAIFGGSVPKQYVPAVEKGLRDAVHKGVLAGFPVVNIKATLFDGSYHAVDSNENAFKMAASIAFKKGMEEAKPILLEPVMHVEINVPDDYMGDIMGDMNKRRGRILGMEQFKLGYQRVIAEAPQSEMFAYATDLRSMTQARGQFVMRFERYDEVPTQLSDKIVELAKKDKEEEHH